MTPNDHLDYGLHDYSFVILFEGPLHSRNFYTFFAWSEKPDMRTAYLISFRYNIFWLTGCKNLCNEY